MKDGAHVAASVQTRTDTQSCCKCQYRREMVADRLQEHHVSVQLQ